MKLQFKNIHFVGTSHISKDSIQEVQESISENKPKLIAIELDKPRLYSLISKKKRKLKTPTPGKLIARPKNIFSQTGPPHVQTPGISERARCCAFHKES